MLNQNQLKKQLKNTEKLMIFIMILLMNIYKLTKDGLPLPPSSVLWLDELYAQYQMWYKATISDSRAPKRKDLEEYITKIFGLPLKKEENVDGNH